MSAFTPIGEAKHRRKLIPAESARVLAELRNLRTRAEYTPEMMPERAAGKALRLAKDFLSAVERRLQI